MPDPVRVRFAPSPTGYLHIGGARTALFNWLFARQQGGVFVLRMEDTDEERNTEAARQTIFRGLEWLGLTPDEGPEQGGPYGPYSQSERQDLYVEHARRLVERDAVYPCFCTKERLAELRVQQEAAKSSSLGYDRRCRGIDPAEARRRVDAGEEHTLRLKVPEDGANEIDDLVRGRVTVASRDIEDIILVRTGGVPVYNFAVVVDDHLMRITHVVRGEDHLTNTFKQVLIHEALGWERPVYAHLPLILGPAGEGKLSKRKHPEAALELYQRKGYPVEALINWLALVGWSLDDKTVRMSRDQLVSAFSFERVNASGARLPLDKLDWLGGEYIRDMTEDEIVAAIRPVLAERGWIAGDADEAEIRRVRQIAAFARERMSCFSEVGDLAAWVYEVPAEIEPKALKNLKKAGAAELLEAYAPVLLGGDFSDPAALEAQARAFVEERGVGFGKLVHPVRAALTRRTAGPGLFDCAVILGVEECRRRIGSALAAAAGGAAESGP